MSTGRLLFVGCGPGAPDLLTLRAVHVLQAADVVIWNSSLLDRDALLTHTRPDVEIVEWPPATQADIDAVYERARIEGLLVVRLKSGDPMLFGELERDVLTAHERGLPCEYVPGISALGATAAALGERFAAEIPLLLVKADGLSDGPGPCAIVIHGAGREPQALQRALLGRGLSPATVCAVAIDASRADEMLLTCPLDELAETLEDMALGRLTLVVTTPNEA